MKSYLILTCLSIIGWSMGYGVSRKLGIFLHLFTGEWDNKAQYERLGSKFDFIQAKMQPVKVSLFSDPVVLIEEDVNNKPRLIQLGVVTENMDGNVDVKLYTVNQIRKYKAREFNVEDLSKLTHADLHTDDDCLASFIVSERTVAGNFPQCAYTVNGMHPRFAATFSCDEEIVTVPLSINQTGSVEPYDLRLTNRTSPMLYVPEDFVVPCSGKTVN